MSDFLAIATVTATLGSILQAAVGADVPGATVTTHRPENDTSGTLSTGLNIYLYRVTPNAALRNADLPARRPDGQTVQRRPQVALDLHYLLSFYGNEIQLEPQRLLGTVVRQLHSRPLLTRQMIRDTITSPSFAFLATANLADAVELVRFTPLALSLEELSKLWSVFFQTSYALSIAYQASVVLIEEDIVPLSALPVTDRHLFAVPFARPVIDVISPQTMQAGGTLTIQGYHLRGDVTNVKFGTSLVAADAVSDKQIAVTLPPAIQAGVHTVQVIHDFDFGTPTEPRLRRGFESNVAAFVLAPTIVPGTVTSILVELTVNPVVIQGQRLVLLLNERVTTAPAAYTFTHKQPATGSTVQISISGVQPGEYFVRLQVDGAESLVDLDPSSPSFGPTVTIT